VYTIKHNCQKGTVEIKNTGSGIYGKIHLNDGGSLQELVLNGEQLIAKLTPLTYKTTYASAILFPFANRIEDGKYQFKNERFQLETNNKEEHNALHGLVYNKPFEIKEKDIKTDRAKIVLQYTSNNYQKGFPFPYTIQLTYTFRKSNLDLKVKVINIGFKSFPFTLGWHPYFVSDNLNESCLNFKSTKKLLNGQRNIALGLIDTENNGPLCFGDRDYDDCWMLNNTTAIFSTPRYNLDLITSQPDNFLQVYTPPKSNTVAIEPTTGVSNSFNNKIGLKTLKPNEVFEIKWSLQIHVN
jgi:aldose 1-epimerase